MRAFVVTGAGRGVVEDVPAPVPRAGEAVVEVDRVGVCGTDVEFFTGVMAYLHQGHAAYPLRLGHEWAGTVVETGPGVDQGWVGSRVTGDTMLGCGTCARCRSGRQHVCADRYEIGIRGGWPGALAERLPVPVRALHRLPDTVDATAGALVEPGGNALRAVEGADLRPGDRLLVWGSGTIGMLCALFARRTGAQVHLAGVDPVTLALARDLGVDHVHDPGASPEGPYDAVIDATYGADVPARALDLVEPGRHVVYIGLAGEPSPIDTRTLVLKDVTAVGVLSASPGLAGAIDAYARGQVDPRPLVAATVGLDGVAAVLAGERPEGSGPGPKVHVDPRIPPA
ncbi:MAG: alcohol dehydrogenase catalytic domain-containing protein [Candidatus Nanopelagicales bacterium]